MMFLVPNMRMLMKMLIMAAISGATAKRSPQDFLVQGLGDIEPAFSQFNGTMYAGLLPFHRNDDDDGTQGEFMFWLFEPHAPETRDTLSIYLSGGPGCSSIGTGNFFGTGPVGVPKFPSGAVKFEDENGPLQYNPYSWAAVTKLLYVEQPAPTGFSHGPIPNNEDDVARDMYNFLLNFYEIFDHLQEKNMFLWGGSYSGMNVPALARKIAHQNKAWKKNRHTDNYVADDDMMHMNLRGVALGNAWVDPKLQGPAAVDFAWSHGMIDLYTRDTFKMYWQECMKGRWVPPPMHPFTVPDDCGLASAVLESAGSLLFDDMHVNAYDISTWDPYAILEDDGTIAKFYNNPAVKKALHAPDIEWLGCVESGWMLNDDKPESVVPYIAELLDTTDIRIIFWNGDKDLLCCHTGTELVLDSMEWSQQAAWKTAPRGLWVVDDRPAGYTKSLGNLEFVTVYNSGHMVYHNQPARALDLVERFIKGDTLLDNALPTFDRPDEPTAKVLFRQTIGFQFAVAVAAAAVLVLVLRQILQKSRKRNDYERLSKNEEENKNGGSYGTSA